MSYGEELTACFRNIAEIKDETTKNYFLTLFRLWLPPSYNISFVDVNDNVDTKNAEEKKKTTFLENSDSLLNAFVEVHRVRNTPDYQTVLDGLKKLMEDNYFTQNFFFVLLTNTKHANKFKQVFPIDNVFQRNDRTANRKADAKNHRKTLLNFIRKKTTSVKRKSELRQSKQFESEFNAEAVAKEMICILKDGKTGGGEVLFHTSNDVVLSSSAFQKYKKIKKALEEEIEFTDDLIHRINKREILNKFAWASFYRHTIEGFDPVEALISDLSI